MLSALLLRFAPYRLVFELAIIGSAGLYGAYEIHKFLMHERALGAKVVQDQWDAQKVADAKAAAERETLWTQRLQDADQHANEREQTIRTLAAAAGGANERLHDTLATIRNGISTASPETLGKTVTTLSSILGECTGRYRELAEKADRHAADVKTLEEAWPTDQPLPKKN